MPKWGNTPNRLANPWSRPTAGCFHIQIGTVLLSASCFTLRPSALLMTSSRWHCVLGCACLQKSYKYYTKRHPSPSSCAGWFPLKQLLAAIGHQNEEEIKAVCVKSCGRAESTVSLMMSLRHMCLYKRWFILEVRFGAPPESALPVCFETSRMLGSFWRVLL